MKARDDFSRGFLKEQKFTEKKYLALDRLTKEKILDLSDDSKIKRLPKSYEELDPQVKDYVKVAPKNQKRQKKMDENKELIRKLVDEQTSPEMQQALKEYDLSKFEARQASKKDAKRLKRL